MSDTARKQSKATSVRARDVFVVIFCIFGFALSLFLFQRDLFTTLRSSAEPAGIVTVKFNTVQRRLNNRAIWDRLYETSTVYDGDLIRIARVSGATINIDENYFELDENTLIRIQKGSGATQIELFSGAVNIDSNNDAEKILLSIGEQLVEVSPGAVFSASSGDDGVVLQLTEGTMVRGGQVIHSPAIFVQDAQGNEVIEPSAVVSRPRANARLLKTEPQPLNVEFSWAKMNMRPSDLVRLEISEAVNFSTLTHQIENLDTSAVAALNAGLWHWRLSFEGRALASGRVNVTEASAPELFSPAQESRFAFRTAMPEIQFRWSEVTDVMYYNLQVSDTPDFQNTRINTQAQSTALIANNLGSGTWYWRVRPIFPNVYEGVTRFSGVSSFRIEQSGELAAPSLVVPVPNSTIIVGEAADNFYFTWDGVREAGSYTIFISSDSGMSNSVMGRTVRDNYFIYGWNENILVPGQYYWAVSCKDADGNSSQMSQPRAFVITQKDNAQRLVFPPDRYRVELGQLSDLVFTWETNLLYDRRFQVSSRSDFSVLTIDESLSDYFYQDISLPLGEWYWRITAKQDALSSPTPSAARRFTVVTSLAGVVFEAMPQAPAHEPVQTQEQELPPLRLRLISPANGASISGLTALREPTFFRWDTTETVASSRFVLSRRSDPARGRAEVEILNPGRAVSVPGLGEGTWYWTVEARSQDGRPITAVSPRQLRIQSASLLSAPGNRLPASGYVINADELRQKQRIDFSWSAVQGANAYILTIERDSLPRRRILQTDPMPELSYSFDDFRLLGINGNFFWQIEAVRYSNNGVMEQRGRPGENTFVLDVPRPERVQTRDMGIIYGME